MDKKIAIEYINVDCLIPDEENPNVQKDAVFNSLVENIQEIGMVEPLMVAPAYDEEGARIAGKYRIVSGHHRYEACKLLDYVEVPCVVQEDFDEDMQKFQLVRMNMLRGKLDPVKFTQLYTRMADKYGEELVKHAMALVDEDAFNKLFIDVKKEMPKEIQDKLEDARDDIKTVDDLSRILNSLFSRYGDTLHQNFMVFSYGGKTHLWVTMSKELKDKLIDGVVEELKEGNYDINQYFDSLITTYSDEVIGTLESLPSANEDIEF